MAVRCPAHGASLRQAHGALRKWATTREGHLDTLASLAWFVLAMLAVIALVWGARGTNHPDEDPEREDELIRH